MTITAAQIGSKIEAVLVKHGRDITITSEVHSYDPTTGTNTPTLTDHTVRSTPPYSWSQRFVSGNTVREGDVLFLVSGTGLTFTLAQGQKVTDGARVYRIMRVNPFTYDCLGSTFTAYEIQTVGDG